MVKSKTRKDKCSPAAAAAAAAAAAPVSCSGDPPRILNRGWLENCGQIIISLNSKTKRIAFFCKTKKSSMFFAFWGGEIIFFFLTVVILFNVMKFLNLFWPEGKKRAEALRVSDLPSRYEYIRLSVQFGTCMACKSSKTRL